MKTDESGHVWASVWIAALGAGIPAETAKILADAAQAAAIEAYQFYDENGVRVVLKR